MQGWGRGQLTLKYGVLFCDLQQFGDEKTAVDLSFLTSCPSCGIC